MLPFSFNNVMGYGVVNQIKFPVKEEILLFEKKFKESMGSSVPLLDTITHYIIKRKGKQMRPMCGIVNFTK